MTSIIVALLLFGLVAGTGGALLAREAQVDDFADMPRRLPSPGVRDRHSVSYMLGRAPVPTWG